MSDPFGTATGRWPSKGPNMQNIPIRTPEGKAIRDAFINCGSQLWDYPDIGDPCDEMVTVRQVIDVLIGSMPVIKWYGGDYYDRAAVILGLERSEAKRLIYKECYSG